MEEEEGRRVCSGKKQRLQIDFDKCFEYANDEPPPEIVIVKTAAVGDDRGHREQSQGVETMEELWRLTDQELEDKIRRMAFQLDRLSARLPDKGEKLKANLRSHEEERARRKMHTGKPAIECKSTEDSERSRPNGVSAEVRGEVRLGSQFGSLFSKKLETDKDSHTRIYDAFDEELQILGHGDRRKRKQKIQVPQKGREKNVLSWKGSSNPSLASSEINTHHQNDLAENNDRHRLKNACHGLHSDKSNADKTVVLLDEEDPDLGEITPTADEAALRDMIVYYPSRNDPECIEIQYKDLKCLASGEYLTSTIMNFYMRFLQEPSSAANDAPRDFHFFNTYFYKKLQEAVSLQNNDKEASFPKLRRWWRGVNLFEKAYIFLPVHEDLHWSLAIICIPDKKDESGPIILHLDSLGYHYSGSIFENIKRFLREEWKLLKEEIGPPHVPFTNRIWENLAHRIEEKIIEVPRQKNDSDCGLFVLYFMERFIKDIPQRLKKQKLGMFGRSWFKPEEASGLRLKIRRTLMKEFGKSRSMSKPVTLPSDCDSTRKPVAPQNASGKSTISIV